MEILTVFGGKKLFWEKECALWKPPKKTRFFLSGQSTKRGRVVRGCKLRKKLLF